MSGGDFALSAGSGHYGTGGAVMPGQGRIVERAFTPEERAAFGDALPTLGKTTFDIHLNACAFRRNVPAAVWNYKLGSRAAGCLDSRAKRGRLPGNRHGPASAATVPAVDPEREPS